MGKREERLSAENDPGTGRVRWLGDWRSLPVRYASHRYAVLFFSLLLTLVAAPIVAEFKMRGFLIELLLLLNLAAAAFGAGTPRERNRLLVIVICSAILGGAGDWLRIGSVSALGAVLWVVLAVAAAISAVRFALKGRQVDAEHICAALSAYLLAGHFFGIIYWQLEELRTGSFAVGGTPAALGQIDLQTSIYFSFVTLATLGYGDILPVTPVARGFSIAEAVLGQLYLAVLVARLVSAYAKP